MIIVWSEIASVWSSLRAGNVKSYELQLPNKSQILQRGWSQCTGEKKIIWYVLWQDVGSILE